MVNTDEYSIYTRLSARGYVHVTVNHSEGEYARDADGDGVNEVHVNTVEGLWSLLRSWLRPHRDISQRFYRCTSAFSRRCTTSGSAVIRCLARCSPCFSLQLPETQEEPTRFSVVSADAS
ncbi:transposase (plasmid) [Deinococcus radiomollis]|uniref:transposase n=1 Tax=Deinococcus radiomollis TaxID=468916 RepID=UPI003891F957